MNPEPNNPADDLTEGWPVEAGNAELARFARQLREERPELSAAALDRVHDRLRAALAAPTPQRPPWRLWLGAGLAASVLIALGLSYTEIFRSHQPRVNPSAGTPASSPGVQDRYSVRFAEPTPPASSDGSLLRLDDHQSLFNQ